jgi:3-methyl-2-oxobutanoate hydroxymethyltransferase
VLVCNDLLGFDMGFSPKFLKRYAELQDPMIAAVRTYVDEVRSGQFPSEEHAFHRSRKARKIARLY